MDIEIIDKEVTCPRCGTVNAGIKVLCVGLKDPVYFYGRSVDFRPPNGPRHIEVPAICNVCRRIFAVGISNIFGGQSRPTLPVMAEAAIEYTSPIQTQDAPRHLPPQVENAFKEAIDNLRRSNLDSAVVMFRRALEIGLKIQFPDLGQKEKLYPRIKKLAEMGRLSDELVDAAHKVRLDGNDAAHVIDTSSQNYANAVYSITELILEYLFTLPGELKAHESLFDQVKAERSG
ncbi:MAG: DUF4145 domain-containing protein [Alphaproteobacteria bacterium]|nr:DUF4145 domain-containing protein [Alphaproteobacteria bacterium]